MVVDNADKRLEHAVPHADGHKHHEEKQHVA